MTEEQAYAAIGRMAVRYARELRSDDFCPRDDMDDCTIRVLGMADMLDQMEEVGAFGVETTEHELCDTGCIQWHSSEECKPEFGKRVLVALKLPTGYPIVTTGYWLGGHWECSVNGSNEDLTIPMHWAPLNLPEEDA